MKRTIALCFWSIFCSLLIFPGVLGLAAVEAAEVSRDKTFVMGRVTENPKKHHTALEQMGGYLQSHLADLGYEAFDVVVARDISEMLRFMREGKVDALSETPFSAVRLIDDADAVALLREWKKGVSSYKSVFFADQNGAVTQLTDLKGKRIAFENPGSTSAFLIPLAELRKAGVEAVKLDHIEQKPPADKVGYVFTHDEMTQLMWVARGTVDAGAFSNLNWADFSGTNVVRDNLRLFYESKPVLRSVFVVRGDLPDPVKARIAETLMAMGDDEQGRRVLKVYNEVLKYDQPDDAAMEASMTNMRELLALLPEVDQ